MNNIEIANPKERKMIEGIIEKHEGYAFNDPFYNSWSVVSYSTGYTIRRDTWWNSEFKKTFEEVIDFFNEYFHVFSA